MNEVFPAGVDLPLVRKAMAREHVETFRKGLKGLTTEQLAALAVGLRERSEWLDEERRILQEHVRRHLFHWSSTPALGFDRSGTPQ